MLSWNAYKMSNKFNTIWLKGLNPHIYKVEWLNWTKNFKEGLIIIFTYKLRDEKHF